MQKGTKKSKAFALRKRSKKEETKSGSAAHA
jgi:hypothetical protein